MANNMTQAIPAIDPVPSEVSFTNSAPEMPGTKWMRGVHFRQFGQPASNTLPIDCADYDINEDGTATYVPEFLAFEINLTQDGCREDLLGESEALRAVRLKMEVASRYDLAREFWTGATVAANPSLQKSATLISATAVSTVRGVGLLLQQHQDCTHGAGDVYLHLPSVLLPALMDKNLVRLNGNRITGPMNCEVVVGPGYPSSVGANDTATAWGPYVDPDDITDGFYGQTADEAWVYVSGRPEWAMSPIVIPEPRETHRANDWFAIGRRSAIYRFDTECIFATKVSIPA